MFQATVDRLRWAVGGAGSVEVGQDVRGAAPQGPPEPGDLDHGGGNSVADGVDELAHLVSPAGPVGVAVGGNHLLVDAPGRLDLDVGVAREQRVESLALLVGEQVGAGVQGPARGVERVALVAAVTDDLELDAPAALIERVPAQAHHVEGIHHRHRGRELFGGGGLEAGEPVHRHDLHSLAPVLGALGQPGLERTLGTTFDHVQQPRWAGPGTDGGQVDDDGHVLVPAASVTPHVLVHADDLDPVEPVRIIDQDASSFVQDRGVGGVPRHPETFGQPRHGQVLTDQSFQRPPQCAARELRARRGRLGRVLAPHVPAASAP